MTGTITLRAFAILGLVLALGGCTNKTGRLSTRTTRQHSAVANALTPPQTAFDACAGKPSDASCTVTLGAQTFYGTCQVLPGLDDARLGCMPPRARRSSL